MSQVVPQGFRGPLLVDHRFVSKTTCLNLQIFSCSNLSYNLVDTSWLTCNTRHPCHSNLRKMDTRNPPWTLPLLPYLLIIIFSSTVLLLFLVFTFAAHRFYGRFYHFPARTLFRINLHRNCFRFFWNNYSFYTFKLAHGSFYFFTASSSGYLSNFYGNRFCDFFLISLQRYCYYRKKNQQWHQYLNFHDLPLFWLIFPISIISEIRLLTPNGSRARSGSCQRACYYPQLPLATTWLLS